MKGLRNKIRQFIEAVEWAVPSNIAYLIDGTYSHDLYVKYWDELDEMTKTKRVQRLYRVRSQDKKSAFTVNVNREDIGTQHYVHDISLRDCLARFFYDKGMERIDDLHFRKPADATLGNLYFEFDNGHMDNKQLRNKIVSYYGGKGSFRVIFFMAHRTDPALEHRRIELLFKIVKDVLKQKPNRILGACYTKYLSDGKIYNLRGDVVEL
jgi:hypothetical protein